jgi:hypothetical protein
MDFAAEAEVVCTAFDLFSLYDITSCKNKMVALRIG